MISKTIGFRGTQHFQTHPYCYWRPCSLCYVNSGVSIRIGHDWTIIKAWRWAGEPSLTGPQFSGLRILLLEDAWRKRIQLKVLGSCKLEVSWIPSHMFKLQVVLSFETLWNPNYPPKKKNKSMNTLTSFTYQKASKSSSLTAFACQPAPPRCPEEARNGFDDGKEHRPKAPQPFHRAYQTWTTGWLLSFHWI